METMSRVRTTFFTSANRAYELFVLPYITAVLAHNEDARVEICLDDSAIFTEANAAPLSILAAEYGQDRFLLRDTAELPDVAGAIAPNSVRFVQEPELITTYTYIGDIDILVLESVTDKHLRQIEHTGLPYDNILRPGKEALSGLHFTTSDAYYPVRLTSDLTLNLDEHLLYNLVVARGLKLPDPEYRWRPVHGYHMSLRRGPLSPLGWGLNDNPRFDAYRNLQENSVWRSVLPFFDRRYLHLLGLLDLALLSQANAGRLKGSFTAEYATHLLASAQLVRAIAEHAPPKSVGD